MGFAFAPPVRRTSRPVASGAMRLHPLLQHDQHPEHDAVVGRMLTGVFALDLVDVVRPHHAAPLEAARLSCASSRSGA